MADFALRFATPGDTAAIFGLIRSLAEYERLAHQVTGSVEMLHGALFGDRPVAEVVLAEVDGEAAGFALFFSTFSSFEGKPGIYLEDLFVLPSYRRRGIAKALLSWLAQLVLERQGSRLEWAVLDWNRPAIEFYRRIGAEQMTHRCLCRMTGDRLIALAGRRRSVEVRGPQVEDVKPIVGLLRQNAEFHGEEGRFALTAEGLAQTLFQASPPFEMVLAQSGSEVCGVGTHYASFSTFLTRAGVHLDDLLVRSQFRRQGFGTSLLVYLAGLAVERKAGRLEWYVYRDNDRAIGFYRQLGAELLPEWIPNRISDRALVNLARGDV